MKILPKKNLKRYSTWFFTDRILYIGREGDGGQKFKYLFEFPLPPNLIIGGEVANPAELVKFLQSVKSKLPNGEKYVVVGLSGRQCLTKLFELPLLELKETDQAVRYQADSFFPLPVSQEYLDWMVLEEEDKKIKKVLVCGVPKMVIDNFIGVFHQLLLYPIAFEPMPVSVFRTLPADAKQNSLVIESDEGSTIISLFNSGNLIANSLVGGLEKLSDVAKKMIDFYSNDQPIETQPRKILLIGKKAEANILADIQLLGEVTYPKSPFLGLPSGRENELFGFASLCNKEVTPADDVRSINLLPKHLATKYWEDDKAKKDRQFYFIVSAFSLVLLMGMLITALMVNRQIAGLKNSNNNVVQQTSVLEDLLVYLPKASLISRLPAGKQQLSKIVKSIYQIDSAALLTGMSYNSNKKELIITGTISTWNELTSYRDKLDQLGLFKKISLPLSSLGKDGASEFRLVLSL